MNSKAIALDQLEDLADRVKAEFLALGPASIFDIAITVSGNNYVTTVTNGEVAAAVAAGKRCRITMTEVGGTYKVLLGSSLPFNGGTVLYGVDTDTDMLTLDVWGIWYTDASAYASTAAQAAHVNVVLPRPGDSVLPLMDGTADNGSATEYARYDHVHPTDTSRLSTTGNAYRALSIPFGALDNTSTGTVMTATVDGITELRDGVCVWLKNGVIASASGCTLNINSLGAKPIYKSVAATTAITTEFGVNYTMLFVYNSSRVTGGCWDMVYGYDSNTTYTPVKLGFGYATCSTAEATAAKTASISSYALTAGGIVSIKFTNAVPAGATLNISSKGAKEIYYQGAAITAGVIKAGDTATFVYSTYYHLIAIDRDAVAVNQGVANAGKFLVVGNDGVVAPVTMTAWQGGSY